MLITGLCLILLLPATAACLWYVVPTLVGRLPRLANVRDGQRLSFAVMIPAHDEEFTLPTTLSSLRQLSYPSELMRIYVIADNCTDRTAAVAAEYGMACLTRTDPVKRGKGFAIAFALEAILPTKPDAILMVDADCELSSDSMQAFAEGLSSGFDVVQAVVRSRNADDGPAGYVAAVGSAIDRGVAVGLARLGQSVPLRGTGMAFRREVLESIPWNAFGLVEDAEYAARLRRAGVHVGLATGAEIRCESPVAVEELCRQRRRWRGAIGITSLVNSKPLVLAQLFATIGICFAAGSTPFVIWAGVLAGLTVGVYLRGVAEVGLTWRRVGLAARAPGVVARLGWVTLLGFARRGQTTWHRTRRRTDRQPA